MKLPTYEFVYCFWSPDFPMCAKAGFSCDWRRRLAEVQAELSQSMNMPVKVKCVFCAPLLFARKNEKVLHRIFAGLRRCDMPYHSGKDEWFWCRNYVTCALAYLGIWKIGRDDASGWLLAALFAPFPLDIIICILFFALAQYAAVVVFFWFAFTSLGVI